MDKIFAWLDRNLIPFMTRLSEQRHLKAVRDGIISTIPLIIVGSFFLIIAFPPVPALAALVKPYTAQILLPFRLTMGLMALYAAHSIGYHLARSYKLDGVAGGILALAAFLLTSLPVAVEDKGLALLMENLGGGGMFVAIIMAIFAVEILRFAKEKKITIRMPEGVPDSVARSFEALVPAGIIIPVVWAVRHLAGFDIQHAVTQLFTPLVTAGNTMAGVLAPIILISLLWATGIHGDSVVGTVARPMWLVLLDQNIAAAAAGQPPPNIGPEPFFQWFVFIGGSGATIGLVCLMLFSKSAYLRGVGKASFLPGVCNINEPIIFGAPIMLNPLLFVPFLAGPVLMGVITWLAMNFGLVAKPFILVPWTLPAPIGAYLTTGGDWRAIVLVAVNATVATAIYYPFFKAYERKLLKESAQEDSQ
ncbi:PTS sugar transporter subunit IIC [Anaeroselena agilis]|uniref:Permease IIC component n=1 Tax=Anaeroselena agilis TaxID=3063788 RepID=A0ABU3NY39_9FIRM|nr:PTS sugar transporter subunit IIC [Selenomonadales bacterium 4137-cl]